MSLYNILRRPLIEFHHVVTGEALNRSHLLDFLAVHIYAPSNDRIDHFLIPLSLMLISSTIQETRIQRLRHSDLP